MQDNMTRRSTHGSCDSQLCWQSLHYNPPHTSIQLTTHPGRETIAKQLVEVSILTHPLAIHPHTSPTARKAQRCERSEPHSMKHSFVGTIPHIC